MKLLDKLNTEYSKLHTAYEELFWKVYMGHLELSNDMNRALKKRDAYRADKDKAKEVDEALKTAKGKDRERLLHWQNFFSLFQTPEHAVRAKEEAHALDAEIAKVRQERKEGYVDPYKNIFIEASENKMRGLMVTESDEKVRRAIFDALQELPYTTLDLYVKVVEKRNEFAKKLGYKNFYDYKIHIDEKMTLDELFSIFEKIYEKTKGVLEKVKNYKPWNFAYETAGDFVKEEDQYFPFEEALIRWGKSFNALGVDLADGKITLDLLDRKGKQNNGFCHYPKVVKYHKNKRIGAEAGISCNAVLGEIGEGFNEGRHTLFHEGGHAVDRLNSMQQDIILNHEYPPSSVSWAETHSMFMDSIVNSIEWKTRYTDYPFSLYEKKVNKVGYLEPIFMFRIHGIMEFERRVYESENINADSVVKIAKETFQKFWGLDGESLMILNLPHIYSWESSGYYHGYGLAELQVYQWRDYFFKKYGYIVDNPKVGKELKKIWALAASRPSKEFIKIATGKRLSPDAYIKSVTRTSEQKIKDARAKIARLEKVKRYTKPVDMKGVIVLTHGDKIIADNKKGFEKMAEKYKKWLNTVK